MDVDHRPFKPGKRDLSDRAYNGVFISTAMAYVMNNSERVAAMCNYELVSGCDNPKGGPGLS